MCHLCDELVNAVMGENINECERLWSLITSGDNKNDCIKWAPRDIRDKCSDSLSYKFYIELQGIGIVF